MRKLLFWVMFVLLLALAVSSLNSAWHDLPRAKGAGQLTVGVTSLVCGVAALVGATGMILRRKWCLHAVAVSGLACAVAGSTASYFYGETSLAMSLVAGIATLAVVALLFLGIYKSLG